MQQLEKSMKTMPRPNSQVYSVISRDMNKYSCTHNVLLLLATKYRSSLPRKNLNNGIKDMPNLRKSSPTYQGLLHHDRFQHPSLANVTLNKEKV